MAFVCSLAIAAYFLRLMADGRKLRDGRPASRASLIADVRESEIPLITAEYDAWMATPCSGTETEKERFRRLVTPDTDGLS